MLKPVSWGTLRSKHLESANLYPLPNAGQKFLEILTATIWEWDAKRKENMRGSWAWRAEYICKVCSPVSIKSMNLISNNKNTLLALFLAWFFQGKKSSVSNSLFEMEVKD